MTRLKSNCHNDKIKSFSDYFTTLIKVNPTDHGKRIKEKNAQGVDTTLRCCREDHMQQKGEHAMIGTLSPGGFRTRELPSGRSSCRHCNWTPAGLVQPPTRGSDRAVSTRASVSSGDEDRDNATARGAPHQSPPAPCHKPKKSNP
jgi:hypothetical protein